MTPEQGNQPKNGGKNGINTTNGANGKNPKTIWQRISGSVHWLIDLDEGLDREGTIVNIKTNKKMQGANAWLLMCSIMIASLGLDLNSPAVIIGAMLISPLMSPILGMGLAVGTNDREMLRISTLHFGIAIAIAIVTSYLYFILNPLGLENPTPEITSRTSPTLLDSLVAIFGGFAGIISSSRKDKTNAVPGVAIATALMPPLCVTGYGLANADFTIILNSFYLFFLNSFFVALSTFLIVRYLKFPFRKIQNPKERRRTTFWLTIFSLALVLPSANILYKVYQENLVNRSINALVKRHFNDFSDPKCLNFTYSVGDSSSILLLELAGQPLSDSLEEVIEQDLAKTVSKNVRLYTFESNEPTLEKLEKLEAQMSGFEQISHALSISEQAHSDAARKAKLLKEALDSIQADTIPFKRISYECEILFDYVTDVNYSPATQISNGGKVTSLPTFYVKWRSGVSSANINRDREKLSRWLMSRSGLDTLQVVRIE